MGTWCDIPLGTRNEITYTPMMRSVLVQCTVEFSRHIHKPLGEAAEEDFLAVFECTVGNALQAGARWTPLARAFVLRFVGHVGKEAERLTTAFGEPHITGPRVRQAAEIAITHAREIEARLRA